MTNFKRGDQIIYIPDHAHGPDHPAVEEGFVTSVNDQVVFCRYWNRIYHHTLRTLTNSEATSPDDLVLTNTRNQNVIDNILKGLS